MNTQINIKFRNTDHWDAIQVSEVSLKEESGQFAFIVFISHQNT